MRRWLLRDTCRTLGELLCPFDVDALLSSEDETRVLEGQAKLRADRQLKTDKNRALERLDKTADSILGNARQLPEAVGLLKSKLDM